MKRLLLILFVSLAAACQQASAPAPSVEAPPTSEGVSPASEPPTTVPQVKVPSLEGKQVEAARKLLEKAGLGVAIELKYSSKPKGVVLNQAVKPGGRVDEGSLIKLFVAKPLPRVMNVVSKSQKQATQLLKKQGFLVVIQRQDSTTQPEGFVISQSPAAGTELRPGHKVTLVVANNPCTSGYSPCLIYHGGSDYDCSGGEGNGPYYTEPGVVYTVSGSDPYDLDADSDGRGCE